MWNMKKIFSKLFISIIFLIQSLLAKTTKFIFLLFADFEVRGVENLEKVKDNESVIFAANHLSELDSLLIGASLSGKRLPIFFVTKPMKNYGWMGWRKIIYNDFLLKLTGSQPVKAGAKNYEESLKKHAEILKKGYNIGIFPEGRRSSDGKIQKPRGGVSFLSYKTEAPVVPIGISGVFYISLKQLLFGDTKVRVNFGEPVMMDELLPEEREPTIDEFKYASYQLMYHRIQPLVNLPAAPEISEGVLTD